MHRFLLLNAGLFNLLLDQLHLLLIRIILLQPLVDLQLRNLRPEDIRILFQLLQRFQISPFPLLTKIQIIDIREIFDEIFVIRYSIQLLFGLFE